MSRRPLDSWTLRRPAPGTRGGTPPGTPRVPAPSGPRSGSGWAPAAARALLAALALAAGTAAAGELPAVAGPAAAASAGEAAIAARFEPGPAEPGPAAPEHGKAFSCDATPVDPGVVEVELAYAPSWWAVPGSVDRAGSAHAVVLAAGLGIARDLDARVAVGWSLLRERSGASGEAHGAGVGDTQLAVRWRFLRLESPAVDLAAVANVTLPTGSRATPASLGTSQEAWSLGGALVASADRGAWTANAELGWSSRVAAAAGDDLGLLVANLALGCQVLPWLQPELELNYQHEVEGGLAPDERVLWASAGVVLPVSPARIVVGMRVPVWQAYAAAGPTLTAAVKLAF
jgi:hypothetical protein